MEKKSFQTNNLFKADDVTGVILTCTKSSRFDSNKTMAQLDKKKVIESITDIITSLFSRNIIVVNKCTDSYDFLENSNIYVVDDPLSEKCSLGGIYSALSIAETEYVFICTCDMLMIQIELITALLKNRNDFDAVVPVWKDMVQPFCAIYSKNCLDYMGYVIDEEHLSICDLLEELDVRFFFEDEVRRVDPEGASFLDIDTVAEYRKAKKIKPALSIGLTVNVD